MISLAEVAPFVYERLEDVRRMKYGYVTGAAGRGKTELIKAVLIREGSGWGKLTATTGIAAQALGENVPTIYSLLRCRNLQEFRDAFESGKLQERIEDLHQRYQRIVIDEASMLLAETFSMIYRTCRDVGMGLILIGDFLQLPPVVTLEDEPNTPKPHWVFQSKYWPEFTNGRGITDGNGIIRLTVNHRQSSPDFNKFLDLLRVGKGTEAWPYLERAGVHWNSKINNDFPGVTLVGRKEIRDGMNNQKFDHLGGSNRVYYKRSEGIQQPEWLDLPKSINIKLGARVMITRNLYDIGALTQANGTLGTVVGLHPDVVYVLRDDGVTLPVEMHELDDAEWFETYDLKTGEPRWERTAPSGSVRYMPLIHAWALTTHKAQGLTLPKVQIYIDDTFMSRPALMYVAASRVKRPEDLYFAGTKWMMSVDPEVQMWV